MPCAYTLLGVGTCMRYRKRTLPARKQYLVIFLEPETFNRQLLSAVINAADYLLVVCQCLVTATLYSSFQIRARSTRFVYTLYTQ